MWEMYCAMGKGTWRGWWWLITTASCTRPKISVEGADVWQFPSALWFACMNIIFYQGCPGNYFTYTKACRSQWPRGLRRESAAARLLRLWVRIPPGAWMFVCCECCVLSGRGLCDELITRPEESYRLWCVAVCDLETSWMRRPWPTGGCCAEKKQKSQRLTSHPIFFGWSNPVEWNGRYM